MARLSVRIQFVMFNTAYLYNLQSECKGARLTIDSRVRPISSLLVFFRLGFCLQCPRFPTYLKEKADKSPKILLLKGGFSSRRTNEEVFQKHIQYIL